MKSKIRKIAIILFGLMASLYVGLAAAEPVFADSQQKCVSILPESWCNEEKGEGIKDIIRLGANILMMGVGVAATVGIVICGVQIMTARDDPAQVQKARKRMIEIAIGLAAWALITVIIQFIIPNGDSALNELN